MNIFYLGVLISPFSISTGKTSIFSTLFSSSYSADAETGSTSSLRRSYSSLEKVLKTCGDQSHSFSTTVFALRMKTITSITDGRSYTEDLHRREHIYHHGRRVWGNTFMEEINTRKKERKRFMRTTVTLRNSCSKAFFFFFTIIESTNLLY